MKEDLEKLSMLQKQIAETVDSSIEDELKRFESIQVHTGCSGCNGTQIYCRVPSSAGGC